MDMRKATASIDDAKFALHRYWIACGRKYRYRLSEQSHEGTKNEFLYHIGLFCFYSSLQVVVEGYQAKRLKLKDAKVDQLLNNKEYKRMLLDCRNADSHFTPEYWDERFEKALNDSQFDEWALSLYKAFDIFFKHYILKLDKSKVTIRHRNGKV